MSCAELPHLVLVPPLALEHFLSQGEMRAEEPEHVARNPAVSEREWERYGHSAVVIGEKVYVIGGSDLRGEHKAIGRVDCYDVGKREWSVVASLPTPRVFAGVAVVDGKIHVVGGISDEDQKNKRDSAVHECYDPATDAWSTLAAMPSARSRLVAAGAEGKLYAIGGMVNTGGSYADSALVEVYDPKKNEWTQGREMPTARHAHAAAVVGEKIFVMGGYCLKETLEPLKSCEVLDVKDGKWSKGPEMTAARSWFGACVVEGCVVVVGGRGKPERMCAPFETWAALECADIDDRRFAVAAVGAEVLVMGGEAGGEWLRVVKP